jgi:hypothetical protein
MSAGRTLDAILIASIRHVRFGSKADMATSQHNVRFTPESGHWNSVAECLLCAKSRLMHRSKNHSYD